MYLYFTGMGIIFQVDISQRVDWSAISHTHANTVDQRKWCFTWYPIFLLHCIALYIFQQLTLIDESKIYLLRFSCHQRLSWPTGWMNHVLPLRFAHYIVFYFIFTLIYFVCFLEFLASMPPGYWVECLYIKKCQLARNPESSSSNIYACLICDVCSSFR